MEKIAGSEDVAPSDVAAICDDDANHVLAFEARGGVGKTPLDLIDKAVHGTTNARALVDFPIRLGGGFGRDGVCQNSSTDTRRGSRGCERGSGLCSRSAGDRGPYLGLLLLDGSLLANAGMNDCFRRNETRAAAGPAAVLDAEYIQGKRLGA